MGLGSTAAASPSYIAKAGAAHPFPKYLDLEGAMASLQEYRDLVDQVAAQIPAKVLDKLKLRLKSDALGLGAELIVTDDRGREWRSRLNQGFTISDEFLAWLCVVE